MKSREYPRTVPARLGHPLSLINDETKPAVILAKTTRKSVLKSHTTKSKKSSKAKRVSSRAQNVNEQSFFPVIGVGASAGGLEAFLELFRLTPPDTGMAFVLVQHLSPKSLSMLTEIVQKSTRMSVREVKDGMKVQPNHVYVIPPNSVLEIFHGVLHLKPMGETQSTNRLIDVFFKSLARDHRNLAVGIVLSGTGSDGSEGLRDIKAEGGISLVQEPESAKYDGMPRMAVAVDHPDHVLPIEGLVEELKKIAANRHSLKAPSKEDETLRPDDERYLNKIFNSIRTVTGVDFSVYKNATILRRIKRRLVLHRIDSIKNYFTFLEATPGEVNSLFNDFLINVTEFFRDPEVFEKFKKKLVPELVKCRNEGEAIRIWVPGCSTGEEAYSLAICLLEYFEENAIKLPIQIYGTDVGESVVKKARVGFFTDSILRNVSTERIDRFFTKEKDGYTVSRVVRDCCIFSVQDVTADPPIHRLDLLSCRNLMIYLGPKVQKKLMETFFLRS